MKLILLESLVWVDVLEWVVIGGFILSIVWVIIRSIFFPGKPETPEEREQREQRELRRKLNEALDRDFTDWLSRH